MKILKLFFGAAAVVMAFMACQKELKFDDTGTSSGSLKKDGSGSCAPVAVSGIYKADSSLNASHFADVQVNVTVPGTFEIKSDTVNGFSFRKVGSVVFGLNTIRLYASGKPVLPRTSTFTIKYGSSTCSFDITVLPANSSGAVFTLGGAPGQCTGAFSGGTYTAGVALDPNNTLTIQVNVTVPGYYAIGAVTTNGFVFSGSGVFTATGLQNVVLTGTGTPLAAGTTAVTISNLAAACSFNITVQQGSGGGGGGTGRYFQFNDGASVVAADTGTVAALMVPNGNTVALSVNGISVTADSSLFITVTTNGNPQTGVTYNSFNVGVPLTMFNVLSVTSGQLYQADFSTPAQNITVKFDVIDVANKIVSGTFSGTAKGPSGTKTITNGKFRAVLQ